MVKQVAGSTLLITIAIVLSFSPVALANDARGGFRAFYFVQQWLASYCNQQGTRCCYPDTGKPAGDFTINGLWPSYNDGSFAYNCGGGNFDVGLIKPIEKSLQKSWATFTCPLIGRKFWVHEWNKHGTCTKSFLSELDYFKAALYLKGRVNVLQALARAGIRPDNRAYPLKSIKKALARGIGFHPWVTCNHNAQGKSQIWEVTVCTDASGTKLINCPYIPRGRGSCANHIVFPSY